MSLTLAGQVEDEHTNIECKTPPLVLKCGMSFRTTEDTGTELQRWELKSIGDFWVGQPSHVSVRADESSSALARDLEIPTIFRALYQKIRSSSYHDSTAIASCLPTATIGLRSRSSANHEYHRSLVELFQD